MGKIKNICEKCLLIFLSFFASFFIIAAKCSAIEIVLHTSSIYQSIGINGFDKYKLKTKNKLTKYYYDSDKNIKNIQKQNEANLTPAERQMKEEMAYRALADFRNPKFISSHRKGNPHLLTTSFGFGFGLARVDFQDQNGKFANLHQQNLDTHNETMLNGVGGFVSFNINLRGIVEFSLAPGLYNGDFIKRVPSTSSATKYNDIKTKETVFGYTASVLFKPFGVFNHEGLVIGGGIVNINNTSKAFFSIGVLLE